MTRPVRKAVILAAGMGTRMLPATKAVPKEMLHIVDRPLLQYSVEEAVAAGMDHIILVIAEGKESIREHFDAGGRLEAHARAKGDSAMLSVIVAPSSLARVDYAYQDQPLGPAHAVACAREFLEGEPFALFYPDDLILGPNPCIGQLAAAYERTGGSIIAVQRVPREEIPQYGVIDPAATVAPGEPIPLRGLVEKPPLELAPSDLAIVGRYILSETILGHIDRTPPGVNGERYVTDALASQIAAGEPVFAMTYEGDRYDTGRPLGMLLGAVAAGLLDPAMGANLRSELAALLARGTR